MTAGGSGWRMRAACADVDPEVFFPVAESGPVQERQVAEAKVVCAGCPVRSECLAWALVTLPHGVAGGLSAEERRGLGASRPVRVGPPPEATPRERAQAGRAALAAGRAPAVVAAELGVSERTALRWAQQIRTAERGAA